MREVISLVVLSLAGMGTLILFILMLPILVVLATICVIMDIFEKTKVR